MRENYVLCRSRLKILMHECEEGYDYSILDEQYHLLDGGVYDNLDITIRRAMDVVVAGSRCRGTE